MTTTKRAELMVELEKRNAAFTVAQAKALKERTPEAFQAAKDAWNAAAEIGAIVTPLKKCNYGSKAGKRQAAERSQYEGRR